ncbi:hypothetical protein DIPPA_27064 [Diplonema papillatum]|nr:hypothetical protein DIPPA_27064 [Diplonema papillatum]
MYSDCGAANGALSRELASSGAVSLFIRCILHFVKNTINDFDKKATRDAKGRRIARLFSHLFAGEMCTARKTQWTDLQERYTAPAMKVRCGLEKLHERLLTTRLMFEKKLLSHAEYADVLLELNNEAESVPASAQPAAQPAPAQPAPAPALSFEAVEKKLKGNIAAVAIAPPRAKKTANDTRIESSIGVYEHLAERMHILRLFVSQNLDARGQHSAASFKELAELLKDSDGASQVERIAQRLSPVLECLNDLSDRSRAQPSAHHVFSTMAAMLDGLAAIAADPDAQLLHDHIKTAWESHPNFSFWQHVRFFDPLVASALNKKLSWASMQGAIPQLQAAHEDEWKVFLQQASAQAPRIATEGKDEHVSEWWARNTFHFPNLCPVVQNVLCMLPVATAADSVFSSIGSRFADMRRARLKPTTRQQLMFLYTNQDIDGSLESADRHHALRHRGRQKTK